MEFTKFTVVLRAIFSVHMKFFPTFSTILKSALNSEFFDTRKIQKIKLNFRSHFHFLQSLKPNAYKVQM